MKQKDGNWLATLMQETGVSNDHLAWALDISDRTANNWKLKDSLNESRKQQIARFFTVWRECQEGKPPSHPHAGLLHKLEQVVGARTSCEVLGLPGMLKSKVLYDLSRRLSDSGKGRRHFLYNLGSESDVAGFWNTVGRKVIGDGRRAWTFEDVKDAMEKEPWTLLLDDADHFLLNVERKYAGRQYEFRAAVSLWIKNVRDLPGPKILTSMIASGDFVALVAGGSPCQFMELELNQWYSESEWRFWTAVLISDMHGKQKIRVGAKGIPVVFQQSLERLRLGWHTKTDKVVERLQEEIASAIWNRLPVRSQKELIDKKFKLEVESKLYKAFLKSGIILEKRNLRPGLLRVPGWVATWKTQAGVTR